MKTEGEIIKMEASAAGVNFGEVGNKSVFSLSRSVCL